MLLELLGLQTLPSPGAPRAAEHTTTAQTSCFHASGPALPAERGHPALRGLQNGTAPQSHPRSAHLPRTRRLPAPPGSAARGPAPYLAPGDSERRAEGTPCPACSPRIKLARPRRGRHPRQDRPTRAAPPPKPSPQTPAAGPCPALLCPRAESIPAPPGAAPRSPPARAAAPSPPPAARPRPAATRAPLPPLARRRARGSRRGRGAGAAPPAGGRPRPALPRCSRGVAATERPGGASALQSCGPACRESPQARRGQSGQKPPAPSPSRSESGGKAGAADAGAMSLSSALPEQLHKQSLS